MNKIVLIFLLFTSLFIIGCSCNNGGNADNNGKKTVENKNNSSGATIHDQLVAMAESMNKQCPIQVDEITTYKNVSFSEKTIVIKTIITKGYFDRIDFIDFKDRMTEKFSRTLDRQFAKYLDDNGYSIKYLVSEEDSKINAVVEITGGDIIRMISLDEINRYKKNR